MGLETQPKQQTAIAIREKQRLCRLLSQERPGRNCRCQLRICWIDGDAGILSYRGIDIHELAEHSTFEECTYCFGTEPCRTKRALREFESQLAAARSLDQRVIDLMRSFPTSATPMEVLRTTVSALSFYDPDEKDNSHDANVREGV